MLPAAIFEFMDSNDSKPQLCQGKSWKLRISQCLVFVSSSCKNTRKFVATQLGPSSALNFRGLASKSWPEYQSLTRVLSPALKHRA